MASVTYRPFAMDVAGDPVYASARYVDPATELTKASSSPICRRESKSVASVGEGVQQSSHPVGEVLCLPHPGQGSVGVARHGPPTRDHVAPPDAPLEVYISN